MAAWDINVSDQSPVSVKPGIDVAGISFGSMGSGIHTTTSGAGLPPWLLPAALALAVVYLVSRKKRGS